MQHEPQQALQSGQVHFSPVQHGWLQQVFFAQQPESQHDGLVVEPAKANEEAISKADAVKAKNLDMTNLL
ncbi:MAG: hypothetical protein QM754_02150 [Tepidisphaeraceae bacterium]